MLWRGVGKVAAKGEDNVGRETAGGADVHARSGGNVVTRALESSVDWSEVDDRSGWWLAKTTSTLSAPPVRQTGERAAEHSRLIRHRASSLSRCFLAVIRAD
jgi:hypothetical protein